MPAFVLVTGETNDEPAAIADSALLDEVLLFIQRHCHRRRRMAGIDQLPGALGSDPQYCLQHLRGILAVDAFGGTRSRPNVAPAAASTRLQGDMDSCGRAADVV